MDLSFNPYPWYAKMRHESPLYFDVETNLWLVFDYATVKQIYSDYQTFSSVTNPEIQGNQFTSSMILQDPPRHRQLRSLATQAFSPRTIENLAPRISEIVHHLLDTMSSKTHVEFIDEFAAPLPMTIIAELIGVPASDYQQFKQWSQSVIALGNGTAITSQRANDVVALGGYFYRMIQERRAAPQEDFLTALVNATIDGEQLSDVDIIGFCSLLLVAGNETTTNLLGNAIRVFYEQPAVYQSLRADRTLIPSAIEEILRFYSPVRGLKRRTLSDVALHGQIIPANSQVMGILMSANRDEQQFVNADSFNIQRSPNPHIAFGYGIHFCLGAPLARLEARIALEAIIQRYQVIELAAGFEPQAIPTIITFGASTLQLNLQPQ